MKLLRRIEPAVYAAIGFHALGMVFYFYRIDSFIKDVFIAPLYFIIPTGVGLFILSMIGFKKIMDSGATKLQTVLLSAFLGIAVISLRYVELTINGQPQHVDLVYYVLYMISVVGYIKANSLFIYDERAKALLKSLMIILPVWLVSYYFFYWHFSPYPFRDIFMETHFMKGAEEFAKHGFVNLATGDTYIPLYQVGAGLMRRFFNFDLIHGQWILPAYLSLFMMLCVYCFLGSFIKDRLTLILSFAGAVAFENYCFSSSNNTYLTGLTLLLFSLLVNFNKDSDKGAVMTALEMFVFSVLSMVFYKLRLIPSYEATIWPYLLIYIITAIIMLNLGFERFAGYAIIILVLIIAPQFHRAASLYIPLMIMLYWIYHVIHKTGLAGDAEGRQRLIYKIFAYPVVLIPLSLVVSFITIEYWPGFYKLIIKLVDMVGMAMVGEHFTSYEGLNAAMADWLRHTPPMMHVLLVALVGYVFIRHRGRLPEADTGLILFSTVSLAVMMILFLSPLPRVHRLLPFPSMMFVVVFSVFLKIYLSDITDNKGWSAKLYAPIILILFGALMFHLYRKPWKPEDVSGYVLALSPLTEILIAIMLGGFALLIFMRKPNAAAVLLIVVLFSGMMLDKYQFITKLYVKSYGARLGNNGIISHYSRHELSSAEKLARMGMGDKTLLFSDPFALAIFEARTGVNGFYTFENLGQFMLPVYVKDIRAALREAFPKDREDMVFDSGKAIRIIEKLDEFARRHKGAMPEARYALYNLTGTPDDFGASGDELGWGHDDFKSNVIWILNEKTLMWAWSDEDVSKFPNGDVGYYPRNGKFSKEYIEKSITPYFEILINEDDRVLVLKLK